MASNNLAPTKKCINFIYRSKNQKKRKDHPPKGFSTRMKKMRDKRTQCGESRERTNQPPLFSWVLLTECPQLIQEAKPFSQKHPI